MLVEFYVMLKSVVTQNKILYFEVICIVSVSQIVLLWHPRREYWTYVNSDCLVAGPQDTCIVKGDIVPNKKP